jgi:HSP20 family protein
VWAPALDIAEESDAYVVKTELPGIGPEDVEVSLEGGLLTITGERRQETETSERQFHRVERRYGRFRRSITLPDNVRTDAVEADFDNGVLTVRVPKAEKAKPRRIEVRGGARPTIEASKERPSTAQSG